MSRDDLRPAAKAYVTATVCLALGLTLLGLSRAQLAAPRDLLLAAVFAGGTTLAWLFPLHFAAKSKLYVDTAAIVAAILLLDPGVAMLVAGSGVLVAHALKPASLDLVQALFNGALAALQAAVGALLLAAAGWDPDHPSFGRPLALLVLPVAGVAMHVVNVLAVATVAALQQGTPATRSWRPALLEDVQAESLAQLSLLATGVVAAVVGDAHPWVLVLLAAPVAGTFVSLERHVRLRNEAEAARFGSDAGLAEAQRIARLGSWEWDLETGRQRWSDETYRIFGFAPRTFAPTRDILLGCVHADDRERIEAAIRRAAAQETSFAVEHRLLLVDGSERIVHQRGEVVVDPGGRPARLVGTVHDITERKALEGLLAHQAFHDPLTDLPNRALFTDRLARALSRSGRAHGSVAVLFLDLDGFKLVNDSLGHAAGDELLVAVGERLRTSVSPSDAMVARFGGDEFAILLERVADPPAATAVAAGVIAALRPPFALEGQESFVTASVGIAVEAAGRTTPSHLLRAADIALYRAKAIGAGGYAIFEPAMQAQVLVRLQRETALRRAVERGELRLHYQPEVELATGRAVGVEALVRWEHPDLGLLPPGEFIRLAEETGLILPLGAWALRESCRQARAWRAAVPGAPLVMGVNLSARQLQDAGLATEIAALLAEQALDPRHLELEVTESVAMADEAQTRRTLGALRDLGVRVVIDDFGTGYSSLGRLRELAPDGLKVDRSFVAGLGHDVGSRAIIRAVATLAHDLGLVVTAKGIETAEQMIVLRDLGVDRGQGFYFAPPAAEHAIGPLLRADRWPPGADGIGTETGAGTRANAATG